MSHFPKDSRQPILEATATEWERIFNDVHIRQFSSHTSLPPFITLTRWGRDGFDVLLTILATPSNGAAVIACLSIKSSSAFLKTCSRKQMCDYISLPELSMEGLLQVHHNLRMVKANVPYLLKLGDPHQICSCTDRQHHKGCEYV